MLTGVTKKFLGELSGGQKSLLALSLILGLLKYKVKRMIAIYYE
jgi:chromosome segregation ATPase